MNISGILVVVSPAECEASISVLNALPGVEVHHSDKETGRIVVTQEAQTVHEEIEGLKRIKGLPSVAMAEMVYHFIDDGTCHRPGGGAQVLEQLIHHLIVKESPNR